MPKWPLKWPFRKASRDRPTEEALPPIEDARTNDPAEEALRRIEGARRNGARSLDLSALKLTTLPEAVCQLSRLQTLDLSRNQLTTLPEAIGRLSQLQILNLTGNQLTTLPEAIGRLSQLQILNLTGNQLNSLAEAVCQLSRLQTLDLSRNQLTALPEAIGRLSQLQILNLTGNQLNSLAEAVCQLSQLQTLDLSRNQLTTLPEAIGRLSKLQTLYLTGNQLNSLAEAVCQLYQLERLSLLGNRLSSLPKAISQLSRLKVLSFSENQLSAVPEAIGELYQLETLGFTDNQLTTLPEAIGRLFQLKILYLSNNQLSRLPEGLRNLDRLEQLFLQGNGPLGLPDEVLGPTLGEVVSGRLAKPAREILNYYFATRGAKGQALRELKLIVVGLGKAGKTTLIKRLAGERMDPNEPETHGIMIRPLMLHCTDGEIRARVWDFGGQHVLHAMHEFFLTTRSLYLLVLEERGDRAETDAKYWLQLIRSYAGPVPVVVALNKSRGVERPLDRDSLQKLYGPIVAWVPTECMSEEHCPGAEATIAALRRALTTAAEERWMPEPRKLFPRKWVAIKEWLEGLDKEGKNYLDYDTFARECAARGEPDPEKQAEVAALMHDLGIAMNYGRDERLRDTTVLRPDWLANGIYAVLRANLFVPGRPLVSDAVLTPEKLGEIYAVAADKPVEMLKARDYPPQKWEFLLRLMNVFQLSFPLNEEGTSQLCPALLQPEPPPGTDELQGDDLTRLRYEFAVVPAPLLPRFMVRTFSLIQPGRLWQRGVMLRYPDARARVWTTAEEKYLFATVAGPEDDRRELLSMIRGTLADLFGEYKELRVTEQQWFDGQWVPRRTLERFGVLEPEWVEDPGGEEETKL
jgi:internalin A